MQLVGAIMVLCESVSLWESAGSSGVYDKIMSSVQVYLKNTKSYDLDIVNFESNRKNPGVLSPRLFPERRLIYKVVSRLVQSFYPDHTNIIDIHFLFSFMALYFLENTVEPDQLELYQLASDDVI